MVLELDRLREEHHDIRRLRAIAREMRPNTAVTVTVGLPSSPEIGPQLRARLQRAGFLVEGQRAAEAGSVHVHARRVPDPVDALAVAAWGSEAPGTVLDLRYAPDEAEWLDPHPDDIWSRAVASTRGSGAELVSHYPVADSFGAARGAPVIGRAFGCELEPSQVSFGAGVTSLLLDLWGLCDGGPIACPPLTHGDLAARAFSQGIAIRAVPEPTMVEELIRALTADPPALLHFDRPTFTGHVADLGAVKAIVDAAARVGALVTIDEAGATYMEAAASAISLVNGASNLVVLRGFTKAYSWGGLRAGFAVASREIAREVRNLIAPMQVSETALAAVLQLLEAGDCLGRLRPQIRTMRANAASLLARSGLAILPGHPDLPWIALDDHDQFASTVFARCGIRPLHPSSHPGLAEARPPVRLTVPLSEAGFARFAEILALGAANGEPVRSASAAGSFVE
jgi:histidinol-phosphate/aromatic aminotransferase/cobyric acid decarboxylase-like protein